MSLMVSCVDPVHFVIVVSVTDIALPRFANCGVFGARLGACNVLNAVSPSRLCHSEVRS